MNVIPPLMQAFAYPTAWRFIAAALLFVSRASLPIIFLLLVLGSPVALTEPRLVRLVIAFSLLPALIAAIIRRSFAAHVESGEDTVVLHRRGLWRRGQRIELDRASIERAAAWRIPLPGPGVTLRTASKGDTYRIQTDDPGELLRSVVPDGAGTSTGASRAAIAFADARRAVGLPRWYHRLGKWGLFPLLPTFIFFRLHQYIMFGGLLGQYYLEGLKPYLSTLVFHWVMVLTYLVLYASLWRVLAEGVSLLAAQIAPHRALTTRRWAERAVKVLYYAGVPALVALRFLI